MNDKWFRRTPVVNKLVIQSTDANGRPVAHNVSVKSGDEVELTVSFDVTVEGTTIHAVKNIKIIVV